VSFTDFTNRRDLARRLGECLCEGRLALLLGAGVSMKVVKPDSGPWIGLPSWPRLIQNLYGSDPLPTDIDLLTAAEDFLHDHCNDDEAVFKEAVRNALYSGGALDFVNLHSSRSLSAIAALIMASRRGRVSSVVTFNLDDVLERFLAYHGLVVHPVPSERYLSYAADVVIYHPHGFLPPSDSPFFKYQGDQVILDAYSYDKVLGDPSNRWSQIVRLVMETNVCLFVGLSDKDDHLRALAANAKKANPYRAYGLPYWAVTFKDTEDTKMARRWEKRGVYQMWVKDYEHDLPAFLFEVCQEAANI
jgi:hypothetical protein